MNMLRLKLATLLLCGFILTACQKKEDEQKWIIENNSSSEIIIQYTYIGEPINTDTIQSGTEKTIFYIRSGVGEDLTDPTEFMFISIANAQDTLIKNENLETNWSLETVELSKRPYTYSYTYQFSVADSDF